MLLQWKKYMSKDESEQTLTELTFCQQCIKWFKTSRKARKQLTWNSLYHQTMELLMPDLPMSQLMIPSDIFQECMQLLLNSFVYMQKKQGSAFVQHLSNDVLVIVEGRVKLNHHDQILQGPIAMLNVPLSRNEKVKMIAQTSCVLLRGDRKQLQKFRNDVIRQDRQKKGAFLSQYLFCGITPVYPLTAVKLFTISQRKVVQNSEHLLVLRSGLVARHSKTRKENSQLTQGCLVSSVKVCELLQMPYQAEEQWFQSCEKCELVGFHIDEFVRIVKLNPQLRKSLSYRLNILLDKRNTLAEKNKQIAEEFNQQFKLGTQTVRMHYPIEFKARPKTANAGGSFRMKSQTVNGNSSMAQFVTFNRYEKMMASKERVAVTKASYNMEIRSRAIIPINYEKKIKQQSKMMKLQSGKIQKLTMRDSKSDCSRINEIKKNLFRVTHLFDEPMDPNMAMTVETKADNMSKANNRRQSGIKPEQFLKEQYLAQYLRKSTAKGSLKDLDPGTPSSNKENSNHLTVPSNFLIASNLAKKQNLGFRRRGDPFKTVFKRMP